VKVHAMTVEGAAERSFDVAHHERRATHEPAARAFSVRGRQACLADPVEHRVVRIQHARGGAFRQRRFGVWAAPGGFDPEQDIGRRRDGAVHPLAEHPGQLVRTEKRDAARHLRADTSEVPRTGRTQTNREHPDLWREIGQCVLQRLNHRDR
jgi:hypothetical protein